MEWKINLSPDNPDTTISLNNLALLYNSQCLYDKAGPIFTRTLAIYEKTVGPNHPTTVTFRRNLEKLKRQQKAAKTTWPTNYLRQVKG